MRVVEASPPIARIATSRSLPHVPPAACLVIPDAPRGGRTCSAGHRQQARRGSSSSPGPLLVPARSGQAFLGWPPPIALVAGIGLIIVAIADNQSATAGFHPNALFWAGTLLIFVPPAVRILTARTRPSETIALLVTLRWPCTPSRSSTARRNSRFTTSSSTGARPPTFCRPVASSAITRSCRRAPATRPWKRLRPSWRISAAWTSSVPVLSQSGSRGSHSW